jgi:hypothetical protein
LPLLFRFVVLGGGLLLIAVAVVLIGYGLSGAVAAWRGQAFHYVLVDSLLHTQRERPPEAVQLPLFPSEEGALPPADVPPEPQDAAEPAPPPAQETTQAERPPDDSAKY